MRARRFSKFTQRNDEMERFMRMSKATLFGSLAVATELVPVV